MSLACLISLFPVSPHAQVKIMRHIFAACLVHAKQLKPLPRFLEDGGKVPEKLDDVPGGEHRDGFFNALLPIVREAVVGYRELLLPEAPYASKVLVDPCNDGLRAQVQAATCAEHPRQVSTHH